MKKIKCLLLLLGILVFSTKAQVRKTASRVEITAKYGSDNFRVIPVGEEGVILLGESDEKVKDGKAIVKSKIWNATLYDTDFNEKWEREIIVGDGLGLSQFKEEDGTIFMLFQGTRSKKNFQIIKLEIETGSTDKLSVQAPSSILDNLCVNNGNVFVGGTTVPTSGQIMGRLAVLYCTCFIPALFGYTKIPTKPLLYYMDFLDNKTKILHPKKKEFKGLADVGTVESTGNSEALFKQIPEKKQLSQGLISKMYDSKGEFIGEYTIKSKSSNSLQSGAVSSHEGNKFVVGTYKKELSKENKKKYKILGWKDGSNGVYFTRFDSKGKQKGIEFYDFTQFEDFASYASEKSLKKIKKKESKGKKSLIGYNLLVHDPVFKGEEIIVVTEAYYAQYRTEARMGADGKMTNVQVFEGWRTTHSLVASFNVDGDLLWSSIFPIYTLSFNLKERVRVIPVGNETYLAYSYDGSIYRKSIRDKNVVDVSETKIETAFEGDKVKNSVASDMSYWYEDYYIAFGYQKIKTDIDKRKANKSAKRKRKVFYFNKIKAD